MSNTYTPNINLAIPAVNDTGWGATMFNNIEEIDAVAAIGSLAVTFTEVPSATLNMKVSAGSFRKSDGTIVAYAGIASQAMTTAATNYLYLTDAGTLTVNTTGWPASTFHVRLATVVAGASTITSVADARITCGSAGNGLSTVYLALAGGTFSDGGGIVVVHTGATNGVQFAGATTEKLAFHGATPVAQSNSANQAAVGALVTATLTDSTGGTASTTLAAIADTATKNAVASLAAQEANTITDLTALKTLVNQLRLDLTNKGIIKGSA